MGLRTPMPPTAAPQGRAGALPPQWQEASHPNGTYYYNTSTGQTSWERPVGGAPGAPKAPSAPKVPFAARLIGMRW